MGSELDHELSTGFKDNAGTVGIGANSTFTVGGSNDYMQSGSTRDSGKWQQRAGGYLRTFIRPPMEEHFKASARSMAAWSVMAGRTVLPGSPGAIGTHITVTGNYLDPPGSFLNINIDIHGSSLLDVSGTASLTGTTLDVNLLNGFIPANGAQYEIIATGGPVTTMFTNPVIQDGNVTFTEANIGNNVFLDVMVTAAVPEPASLVMFAVGIAGAGVYVARRRRRVA